MLKSGGVKYFEEKNLEKSKLLYSTIDESRGFYTAIINKDSQSRVNIPFRIGGPKGDETVEKKFVLAAKATGMDGLSGHRSVGGCRVSMYNTITLQEVQKLCSFMKEFQMENQN